MSYIKLWTEILLSIIVTMFISKQIPMNFHGSQKKLPNGSHDLWERNQKIVYHKIWNPRACFIQVIRR